MRKKRFGFILLVIISGAILGSVFGKLIALIIPKGVVKQFFLNSVTIGFQPFTLDLGILNFTLGFNIIVSVIGVFGIVFAIYLLKWYYGNRL